MKYAYNQKPNTVLTEDSEGILSAIRQGEYSVLVGPNNCGKSFLLKTLTQEFGDKASYIGPQRYHNFNVLGYYTPRTNKKEENYRQFVQRWRKESQNFDNSPINLQQAIAELSNERRAILFNIVEMLLGEKLEILHTVEDNDMSQKYISCGGHNLSYTSSGFRLITTLITCLLDEDYNTLLIDEPELGISPEAQGVIADFLSDRSHRSKYFPHLERLVLATHSTVFLDRLHISNNYSLTKIGDEIRIKRVESVNDFNNIHFFLLGNRLETLYLPTCIILTEGKCDHAYLSRALETMFPDFQLSVINATSDSRMKEILNITGNIFSDLQKSPYRTRILAVLDKIHGADVVQTLKKAGIPEENILIWSKNGIEYFYPTEIIDSIYGAGNELVVTDDLVYRNGVEYKKWKLCEKVIAKIDNTTKYPEEVRSKLFGAVARVGGSTCD